MQEQHEESEFEANQTKAIFALVRNEGPETVGHEVPRFDLVVIQSVGYRANSKKAVKFRQWAN